MGEPAQTSSAYTLPSYLTLIQVRRQKGKIVHTRLSNVAVNQGTVFEDITKGCTESSEQCIE